LDTFLLQGLINGLSIGLNYGLVAIGFTLIFGVLRAVNFAHGEIYTLGAFAALLAVNTFSPPLAVLILIAALVGAVSGWSLERLAFRPFRRARDETSLRSAALREATLISSLAAGIIVREALEHRFGGEMQQVPAERMINQPIMLEPVFLTNGDIIIAVSAFAMLGILVYMIKHTALGLSIRAVADDPTGALCSGVNVNRAVVYTFAIGSSFGAVAGVLIGLYYGAIFPYMGFAPTLKAFICMIMGGMTSIWGALVCAIALGIIESLAVGVVSTRWVDGIAYLLLLVTLLFFPRGLFGQGVSRV
jgi:branched-chain amino acid transport system permease protein